MKRTPSEQTPPHHLSTARLHLLFVSCAGALLLGTVCASDEILANHYISLGYWFTVLKLLHDRVILSSICLVPTVVFLILFKATLTRLSPRAAQTFSLDALLQCFTSTIRRFLLYLAPIIFFFATRHHFGNKRLFVTCFSLCILIWIFGRIARSQRVTKYRAELAAFLPVGIVAPILWFALNRARTQQELLHLDALFTLANILLCSGLFFVLLRSHIVLYSNSAQTTHISAARWFPLAILFAVVALAPNMAESSAPPERKNVILIGIDTLRADHTTLRDADTDRDLTPNLRGLAQKGVLFENAISQSPWTMPAFASILTGQYPHEHGTISLAGKLIRTPLTLPEIFREAEYETAAVVSHLYVNSRHGFSQGFDHFDETSVLGEKTITSKRVTDIALTYLEEYADDPFFLFLHYFDPHYEYRDHAQWDFSDNYAGPLAETPNQMDIGSLRSKLDDFDDQDLQYLRDLYDEEIAYTDSQIGRLIEHLKKTGLDKNTAIVIVSDHGEEFVERGWLGHTISLYEEVIHVPMLAVLPGTGIEGTVNSNVTETRSLFTIITEWAGLNNAHQEESDKSPLPNLTNLNALTAPDGSENVAYSIVWLPDAAPDSGKRVQLSSLRNSQHKIIIDHRENTVRLYDLLSDPQELQDLSQDEPELLDALKFKLTEWVSRMTQQDIAPTLQLKDDEIESLKTLGYL